MLWRRLPCFTEDRLPGWGPAGGGGINATWDGEYSSGGCTVCRVDLGSSGSYSVCRVDLCSSGSYSVCGVV